MIWTVKKCQEFVQIFLQIFDNFRTYNFDFNITTCFYFPGMISICCRHINLCLGLVYSLYKEKYLQPLETGDSCTQVSQYTKDEFEIYKYMVVGVATIQHPKPPFIVKDASLVTFVLSFHLLQFLFISCVRFALGWP